MTNGVNAAEQQSRFRELYDEVQLLLNHLQRLPETRVPKLFEPAFNKLSRIEGSPIPPTNSIQYFLNRITAISVTLGHSDGFTVSHSGCKLNNLADDDPGPQLEDYGFLLWSRDFLAAVTYPASVATIRVTESYREHRSRSFLDLISTWPERLSVATRSERENHELVFRQYGRRLARKTRLYNTILLFLIFLVIWGSVLIFTGQTIMKGMDALQSEAALDSKDQNSLASKETNTLAPDSHPKRKPDFDRRKQELSRLQDAWGTYACPLVILMRAPSESIHRLTYHLFGDVAPKTSDSCFMPRDHVQDTLQSYRYRLDMMVNGLLGTILPPAYAGLGALAALFRRIGRKVESETLGPSDVGSMRYSFILGVLTGTVVGLFSGGLNWGANNSTSFSATALALLGGFASDRVFVMLDGLTDRIFGHSEPDRQQAVKAGSVSAAK